MTAWKARGLDTTDYLIILTLEQMPSASNAKIAERVGVSAETVRLRLHALKERRVLRPDRVVDVPLLGERLQTEVEAVYLPSRLGLKRQHIVFTGIPTRNHLNAIKLLCDAHPYTHYRVVAFGQQAALYAQFDIPPDSENHMRKLYEKIKQQGLCSNYSLVDARYASGGDADLQRWDVRQNKWELEYGKKSSIGSRLSRVEALWSDFMEHRPSGKPPEIVPRAEKFDSLDLILLRELTVNAKPNFTQLGDVYGKNPTTISRRVDRIKERIAPDHMVYFDRSVFDLTYPQIIIGGFREDNELDLCNFYWFLDAGGLPFESRGISDGQRFLLFTMTPPSFAPELSEFFWEHCFQTQVFQIQLDASFTYYFYHKNWNEEEGWRADKEYVFDEPLEAIE